MKRALKIVAGGALSGLLLFALVCGALFGVIVDLAEAGIARLEGRDAAL